MSNSSQQTTLSDDLLNDTLTTIGGLGTDTFTITLPSDLYTSSSYINAGMGNITIASGGVGATGSTFSTFNGSTITLTGGTETYSWMNPVEWADSFPDWNRVQEMCKQYPGLEIALRNFRTIYELVKDDYDNPTPKK